MHIVGDVHGLMLEAKAIYERIGHTDGVLDCREILTTWCTPEDMLDERRRVLAESQATNDHRRTARDAINLAEALHRVGKMPEAAAQAEFAIALLQSSGPASGPDMNLAVALMRLGMAHEMVGSLGKTVDAYRRSLEIFEAGEDAFGATQLNVYLANVYLVKGEPRSAVLHAARAVEAQHAATFVHALGGHAAMIAGHAIMGNVDDASDALSRLEHTVQVLELTGPEHCDIWNTRGLLAMWRGDLVGARMLVHTARSLLRATNDNRIGRVRYSLLYLEANYLASLSTIELEDENHPDAFVFSITAAVLMHRLGRPLDVAACLAGLAEATDDTLATLLLDALLLPLQRMERSYEMAVALLRSATIAAARGEHGLAAHRARNALRRFGDIKNTRRIELAKRLIQAAE